VVDSVGSTTIHLSGLVENELLLVDLFRRKLAGTAFPYAQIEGFPVNVTFNKFRLLNNSAFSGEQVLGDSG
jgi:hypothetical protein